MRKRKKGSHRLSVFASVFVPVCVWNCGKPLVGLCLHYTECLLLGCLIRNCLRGLNAEWQYHLMKWPWDLSNFVKKYCHINAYHKYRNSAFSFRGSPSYSLVSGWGLVMSFLSWGESNLTKVVTKLTNLRLGQDCFKSILIHTHMPIGTVC